MSYRTIRHNKRMIMPHEMLRQTRKKREKYKQNQISTYLVH
jgi:hypothetical protein